MKQTVISRRRYDKLTCRLWHVAVGVIAIAVTLTGCAGVPGNGSGSDSGTTWSPRPTCAEQGGVGAGDDCQFN